MEEVVSLAGKPCRGSYQFDCYNFHHMLDIAGLLLEDLWEDLTNYYLKIRPTLKYTIFFSFTSSHSRRICKSSLVFVRSKPLGRLGEDYCLCHSVSSQLDFERKILYMSFSQIPVIKEEYNNKKCEQWNEKLENIIVII